MRHGAPLELRLAGALMAINIKLLWSLNYVPSGVLFVAGGGTPGTAKPAGTSPGRAEYFKKNDLPDPPDLLLHRMQAPVFLSMSTKCKNCTGLKDL